MSQSVITKIVPTYDSQVASAQAQTTLELFKNAISGLTLNNKLVANHTWELVNDVNTDKFFSAIKYFPYNTSANNLLKLNRSSWKGKIGHFEFINDFENYDFGLLYDLYASSDTYNKLAVLPGKVYNPVDRYADTESLQFYTVGLHTIYGTTASYAINNRFVLYTYSGTNISFLSIGNLSRCILFTYGHTMDDPSVMHPTIIISAWSNVSEQWSSTAALREANTIDVFVNNRRVPDTFSSNIDDYSYNINKLILYKFTHDGYYFDNVFTYDGVLPSEHFIYDGHEYFRLAFDILVRLD